MLMLLSSILFVFVVNLLNIVFFVELKIKYYVYLLWIVVGLDCNNWYLCFGFWRGFLGEFF